MTTKPCAGSWLWWITGLAVAGLTAISAQAATRYVATNGLHQTPFTNWTMAATSLVSAIIANGDVIIVSNGVYRPSTTIGIGRSVVITSLYGAAQTIFDGRGQAVRGIQQASAATSTVYGLTVTNWFGGGFNCEAVGSDLTLVNCVSTCNRANDGAGMRIYSGFLRVSNCVIRGNTTTGSGFIGGGINFLYTYPNMGTLDNCEISGNVSGGYGGGVMAGTAITVRNCTIASNTAASYGGGIAAAVGASVSNCRIIGNLAQTVYGGGAYGCSIDNSLIAYNAATGSVGGGVYGAILRNCTVVSNLANRGGGTAASYGLNSIVFFNRAQEAGYTSYSNYLYDVNWVNCNTAPSLGTNCVTANPMMVNMPFDCRLIKGSPCINAGTNQSWMDTAVDLGGHVRIFDRTVDIGAYEWYPKSTMIMFH